MRVYGDLVRAQLETIADPSAGLTGRVYYNSTDGQAKLDDGTNVYPFLRNDAKCRIGNNGTANSNIRFHRGAAGVLQFVAGGDSTAEGTLSTSLAQISGRLENYTTGALPAAANAGRLVWDTTTASPKIDTGAAFKEIVIKDLAQVITAKDIDGGTASNTSRITLPKDTTSNITGLTRKQGTLLYDTTTNTVKMDDGANLAELALSTSVPTSPSDRLNYGFTATVAANALTITLKTNAGNTPSSGDPVKISFRNATAATGSYSQVSVTAATSIVVPSGATLGHQSGMSQYVYVWALNNAGTVELAVSGAHLPFQEGTIQSSTLIDTNSDSSNVLYSTAARTSKAFRLLGRINITEATAGTWATAPAELSLVGHQPYNQVDDEVNDTGLYTYDGFGTVTNESAWSQRVGNILTARISFTAGTVAATPSAVSLPSKYVIDTSRISTTVQTIIGTFISFSGSTKVFGATNGGVVAFDGSDTTKVFLFYDITNTGPTKVNTSDFAASGKGNTIEFRIPIVQFRSF